jgi:hypothetical protein
MDGALLHAEILVSTLKIPETPAERAAAVLTMLVRGATDDQATEAAREWGATPAEAAAYLAAAAARFQKIAQTVADVERGKALAQLLDLYARTVKNSDYARALQVRKEMSTLLGLTAAAPKQAKPAHDPLADEIERLEKELGVS